MLRPLSSKAQGHKDLWKQSKPCQIGTHWIALAKYSQMSTQVQEFQSFCMIFAKLRIGDINHQQHND